MTESGMDPVLLLAAPNWQRSAMAKDMLQAEGIATLSNGQDQGLVGFGGMVSTMMTRPDLYVQRSAFERACEVLDEAWGPGWRDDNHS